MNALPSFPEPIRALAGWSTVRPAFSFRVGTTRIPSPVSPLLREKVQGSVGRVHTAEEEWHGRDGWVHYVMEGVAAHSNESTMLPRRGDLAESGECIMPRRGDLAEKNECIMTTRVRGAVEWVHNAANEGWQGRVGRPIMPRRGDKLGEPIMLRGQGRRGSVQREDGQMWQSAETTTGRQKTIQRCPRIPAIIAKCNSAKNNPIVHLWRCDRCCRRLSRNLSKN